MAKRTQTAIDKEIRKGITALKALTNELEVEAFEALFTLGLTKTDDYKEGMNVEILHGVLSDRITELKQIEQDKKIAELMNLEGIREPIVIGDIQSDEDGKPLYSFSKFRDYLRCPFAFDLNLRGIKWEPKYGTAKLMDEGKLLEALVFRDKDGIMPSMIGKKAAMHKCRLMAAFIKEQNVFEKGTDENSFIKFVHDFGEYKVRGEVDYIGEFNYITEHVKITGKKLVDFKKTSAIEKIWYELKKEDVLQVVLYSYIHFLKTGEMLDGVYYIIDDGYPSNPLVKVIEVKVTQMSYDAVQDFMDKVHWDMLREPKANKEACLGFSKAFGSRCAYLRACEFGRELVETTDCFEYDMM